MRSATTFYQDQARARERVSMLEDEAAAFTREGKTVPAAALQRRVRLIKYLWCLTPCDVVNEEKTEPLMAYPGRG